MKTYLAQLTLPDGTTIDDPKGFNFTGKSLSDVVNAALPYIFAVAGALLLGYLIWGGFDYLTAMGDPKRAQAGKGKITNAVIGFFIIFVAFWLVQIVNYLFKLNAL